MQYHPDRNQGDKTAEDRFKEINEAYAVLSDPDKRAHYDRFGTAPGASGGRGEVRMSHGFLTVARPCPKCLGEGQINRSPCKTCRGEGRQRAERLLSVKIPAGIDDGMQLRLTGEGSGGVNGGPPGDFYVLVRLREHAMFARNGSDLYCDLPVSFPQLALGADLEVPVLGGSGTLKVPAGSQ